MTADLATRLARLEALVLELRNTVEVLEANLEDDPCRALGDVLAVLRGALHIALMGLEDPER